MILVDWTRGMAANILLERSGDGAVYEQKREGAGVERRQVWGPVYSDRRSLPKTGETCSIETCEF